MNKEAYNLSIAAVERETGFGKDTLRVWERRYGFPTPERDANGERLYSSEQVDKLRRVKRLMDNGQRPGKIFAAPENEWDALLPQPTSRAPDDGQQPNSLIKLLGMHQSQELRSHLQHLLLKQGLERFITDTIAPLNTAVGDAWMRGDIQVSDEHLYTEQVQGILRGAIAVRNDSPQSPRILLTTLPDEAHGLGLLMAEAMLVSEGAQCVSLGTQTPLVDIVSAVEAGRFDVLALSFSAMYPLKQTIDGLQSLSNRLPSEVEIWAGGRGTRGRIPSIDRVLLLDEIGSIRNALSDWRKARQT
jgi:MerR family transcriptional regulator, light-induced transcriptional regulator